MLAIVSPAKKLDFSELEDSITHTQADFLDRSAILVDQAKRLSKKELANLMKISDKFTVAAAFGNVHGVYKPGNVVLTPKILDRSQKYIEEKFNTTSKPINFVFHGGSGSSKSEITEAISYGAIKMNLDTDLQWGFTTGIRDYFSQYNDYLQTQIGNPEGEDKPNKKYYDPRKWIREGELTFKTRLKKSFEDLNNINRNK